MTNDETASLKEWLSEKMDAQNARFETSILRAFNEHRDHDHDPLAQRIGELESDAKGDRRLARWGLAGLGSGTLATIADLLHRIFGGASPRHP